MTAAARVELMPVGSPLRLSRTRACTATAFMVMVDVMPGAYFVIPCMSFGDRDWRCAATRALHRARTVRAGDRPPDAFGRFRCSAEPREPGMGIEIPAMQPDMSAR
jgi:hypothetical protein